MAQNKNKGNKPADQHVATVDVQAIIDQVTAEHIANYKATEGQAGRPVDPNSPRQKKLIALEVKKMLGLGKRGRPVDLGSERQQRLTEMEEKRIANGGILKPGRPAMTESEKKKADAARKERTEAEAAKVAEIAKKQLIKAGLMNKEGELIGTVETEVK